MTVLVEVGVFALAWLALGLEITEFEAEGGVADNEADVAGAAGMLDDTCGPFLASAEDVVGGCEGEAGGEEG